MLAAMKHPRLKETAELNRIDRHDGAPPLRGSSLHWPVQQFTLLVLSALLAACATGRRSPSPPPPSLYRSLAPEKAQDIAIHALGLVGTPYRYGGNTLEGGFDCSGLIDYVYRTSVGVSPPRTVAQLAGFGQPIGSADLRTGDLVLFGTGRPTHAGIYVGNGQFVHAPSSGGDVRLDRLDGPYWSRQPLAARRI